MSDELDVLQSVTAQLEGAGISYMVTGSMAANFYAVPRMTRDIDLVIELSERDVDRVTRLFQQEYYIDRDMVQRAVRNHAMFNMIHNALVVKVDSSSPSWIGPRRAGPRYNWTMSETCLDQCRDSTQSI